jgi:hypothetical protein
MRGSGTAPARRAPGIVAGAGGRSARLRRGPRSRLSATSAAARRQPCLPMRVDRSATSNSVRCPAPFRWPGCMPGNCCGSGGLPEHSEVAELLVSEPAGSPAHCPDAETGRGLLLVEAMRQRWNWYRPAAQGGNVVWGEVHWTTQAEQAGQPRRNRPPGEG